MSFSDIYAFCDDIVFGTLGDDIVITDHRNKKHKVTTPVEWEYDLDELGKRLDSTYPTLPDLQAKHACIVSEWENCTVSYRGICYSIENVYPVHDKHLRVILRVLRID